ncbi:MAG: two-component system, cell cycle sensor histidine kinase and response regulator CckA [Acidobacteriota bacterium]|nr:two-component system, cell cycle sensor histidine kinase and response regulator CckA [Acidobacteriota bacterium]
MEGISNLKIKNKLIGIILLVTIFILAIAFTSIIIFEKTTRLNSLRNEIANAARIAADPLVGALDFGTEAEIAGALSSLEGVTAIKNFYVFDKKNTPVVLRNRSDADKIEPPVIEHIDKQKQTIDIKGKFITVYQPILFKTKYSGMLFLRASTSELDQKIKSLVYFMILLILVLIILSVILAEMLQGIISKPVLNLVDAAKKISAEGNYTIRVQKENNDEIGMLYDAFNDLMEQVLNRNIERDRVEGELKNAQFFLSSVIESMPTLLITIDEIGKITQWNKATARITRIEAAEAVGKNFWEILPDFGELKEPISKISDAENWQEFYKKPIKLKDETYYFNGSIFPLKDRTTPGKSRYVIMLNNITEIELKERLLRQSQKMETVGNLAGGLAHDFNNVLGGIIGTISLFKYKVTKNKEITRQETEKYFNTIEESANRASDMVQHLLSLTRRQELAVTPTDLNTTIKSIVKICKNTFDKSIAINTEYFPGSAMTLADPTQVEQSLLNLCINASHAMTIMRKGNDKYGGTLNISVKKVVADKYFRRLHEEAAEPDYWDISVSDTGVGIDQKTLTKIFDPFFTTKTEGRGTGLGLSMVYNIIKQHNGFINVYSQEGFGATFHIYLPVLEGPIPKEEIDRREEVPHGEGLILVVDDEEVMRQTASSILNECGYSVKVAENGEEALQIFKKYKNEIKAVLLDMVMPRMSGQQTYIELVKIDKNIKVLLVSGFKQDDRVEAILKMGVKGFMQKPYTLVALADRLSQLINEE